MFQGFGKEMIPFFLDLRFHNDKSFMDANRERYLRDVRQPFYDFIGAMGPGMQQIAEDMEVRPVKCLSRINRDTRFSRDKSPYRDHLWVSFRQSGMPNDGTPFYWFEISPENAQNLRFSQKMLLLPQLPSGYYRSFVLCLLWKGFFWEN